MSCASFTPADFASPIGYLGPPETTLYYPTGNLQRDRIIAFTSAMDCLDDLETNTRGVDDIRLASKLSELAQALSDLGLHKHALTTSGLALEIIKHLYAMTPDDSRLDLASVLSLQANILCDLERNDKSIDAAEKAVALCNEHRDSPSVPVPVPEIAYALLNYSVLLCSFGLKDEGAAVAFELQGEVDGNSQPDMKHISALCRLCLSITRIGVDDELALSTNEEVINLSRGSSDADWHAILAGALLIKSKILSSMGQDEAACPFSAEAINLLRTLRIERPLFSLFLADALDTHAHHLSEANRKGEAFLTSRDAVELWQTLRTSVPGPTLRRLAWALFRLARFRQNGGDKNEELQTAETAVTVFRDVSPLDSPGLGEALYLYADRLLEHDKNQDAATFAEESVHYFQEACSNESGKEKYGLDLIFSLSLASSCLVCTERADDAFEYAKQAVQVQHERKATDDPDYTAHLCKLLLDVLARASEINKHIEAFPWFLELNSLGGPEVIGELFLLHHYIDDSER
ncbi:hypothetical protein BGW80DRAFT_268347 [Lactifluus volemus]|nr:hypothetical protein BGW80DRAFT_268347 [Lactifluus volemus]